VVGILSLGVGRHFLQPLCTYRLVANDLPCPLDVYYLEPAVSDDSLSKYGHLGTAVAAVALENLSVKRRPLHTRRAPQ
jgi:hypothetical protein